VIHSVVVPSGQEARSEGAHCRRADHRTSSWSCSAFLGELGAGHEMTLVAGSKAINRSVQLYGVRPRAPPRTFLRATCRACLRPTVLGGDDGPGVGPRLRLLMAGDLARGAGTRLACQALAAGIPGSGAIAICRREVPMLVLAEFGFHAVGSWSWVARTGCR